MTEEKKIMRRKVLAKWLKESLLRLGPTFIKIGQQFSTRVDILPQEYVDQLSELQVCVLKLILIADMLWCFSKI
jgi:predicted unusual protein kinase regulating ubiquinone biosynthesis (AarF/ABC1/UbiB family)